MTLTFGTHEAYLYYKLTNEPKGSGELKSLIQHFSISVAMAINQNEECAENFNAWWRTIQQATFCQNTFNKTANKANFHFSHYKSMEILNCHSNQGIYATAIKTLFL